MDQEQSFRIFSSLLYSSNFSSDPANLGVFYIDQAYLFTSHVERLKAAAEAFGWSEALDKLLGQDPGIVINHAIENHISRQYGNNNLGNCSYRVRILVSQTGEVNVESSKTMSTAGPSSYNGVFFPSTLSIAHDVTVWPIEVPPCTIYVDAELTSPSLFTTHKTTRRGRYDNARARVGISNSPATKAEVLLVNPEGEIMEASLSTPYFLRGGQWITPRSTCGGNMGTTRRWALERSLCKEGVVRVADLRDGEEMWISNGVRGFIKGKLRSSNNLSR